MTNHQLDERRVSELNAEIERLRGALEQIASSKESPVAITPQQNYWRCKDIARAALGHRP